MVNHDTKHANLWIKWFHLSLLKKEKKRKEKKRKEKKRKEKKTKQKQKQTRHDCVIAMTRTLPAYMISVDLWPL